MASILFVFNKNKITIQCQKEDSMKNIFLKYAIKVEIDLEKVKFFYKNKLLDINSEKSLGETVDSNENEIHITIKVISLKTILFEYNGIMHEIQTRKNKKIKNIFEDFAKIINIDISNLIFKYYGEEISSEFYEITLKQFLNQNDKDKILFSVYSKTKEDMLENEETNINVVFTYNGQENIIICKKSDEMREIFEKISNEINEDLKNVYFLFNGKCYEGRNNKKYTQTLSNLIIKFDEIENEYKINILVEDYDNNYPNKNSKETYLINNQDDNINKKCCKNKCQNCCKNCLNCCHECQNSCEKCCQKCGKNCINCCQKCQKSCENCCNEFFNCIESCLICFKDCIQGFSWDRYEDLPTTIYLMKIYLTLFIQSGLINIYILLDYSYNINDYIIESHTSKIWAFVIDSLFITIICFSIYKIGENENRKMEILYLYNIIYVPCIIVCYFLLIEIIKKKEIILCQFSIFTSINLSLLLYVMIFKSYHFFGYFISTIIFSVLTIIPFYYFLIKNEKTIIRISLIGVGLFILYQMVLTDFCLKKFEKDEHIFASIIFNYSALIPIAVLVFLALSICLSCIVIPILCCAS